MSLGTRLDRTVGRIARTYDPLDRVVKVTSYDAATGGDVVNEVQYEYGKYGVVTTMWQAWAGAVNTGTSPKIQYAWSYPTDGSTGLRRTSTTHVDGTTVEAEAYDTTADDLLNRPTGRKSGSSWIFKDAYLGLGRVVEREYGHGTGTKWTLVGTDAGNQDTYLGLDRMGRVDQLYVKDVSGTSLEGWAYRYDYASRLKARQSLMVGSGSYFSETWVRDGLGRPTRHRRGYLSGEEITGSGIRHEECWKLTPASCILEYHGGSSDTCGAPGYTASYNKANEMASRSGDGSYAGYLATGEQVAEGPFNYTFDAWGRLVQERWDTIELSSYTYSGLHRRAHRTGWSLANTYHYYGADGLPLDDVDSGIGATLDRFTWKGSGSRDLIATKPGGTRKYVVTDPLGSRTTTLNSAATAAEARYAYKAYGEASQYSGDWTWSQSIGNDLHLFQEQRFYKDPANNDFSSRIEDPGMQAFLQPSPRGAPRSYAFRAGGPARVLRTRQQQLRGGYRNAHEFAAGNFSLSFADDVTCPSGPENSTIEGSPCVSPDDHAWGDLEFTYVFADEHARLCPFNRDDELERDNALRVIMGYAGFKYCQRRCAGHGFGCGDPSAPECNGRAAPMGAGDESYREGIKWLFVCECQCTARGWAEEEDATWQRAVEDWISHLDDAIDDASQRNNCLTLISNMAARVTGAPRVPGLGYLPW